MINKVVPVSMSAIVFVCLSHNDTIYYGSPYLTLYDAMITAIKARIKQPMMCTITQNRKLPPAENINRHAMRRQQQIAYAKNHNMEVIDAWSEFDLDSRGIANLIISDGVHPNDAGQQLIADTIWNYINIFGI
jgi:lysophospholipase L1-like esterase